MIIFVTTIQASFITTLDWAPNHSPTGGSFIMSPENMSPFLTFCVEENEHFYLGHTYYYSISDKTDGGVNGGQDPVSIGTAWLYSNFRKGTLEGYTGTVEQQTQLQNAFWYLENEIATTDSPWVSLTQNKLGINVDLFLDANGAYGVNVWNLFDAEGNQIQSQLGISTVPEPNSALVGLLLLFPLVWSLRHKKD